VPAVLVTAGPDLAPETWTMGLALAGEGLLDTILVLRPTAAAGAPQPLPTIDGVRVRYLAELAAAMDPSPSTATYPDPPIWPRCSTPADDRRPETGRAHARQRGRRRVDAVRHLPVRREHGGLRGPSAVSRERAGGHPAGTAVQGAAVVWAGPLGYREPALFRQFWKIVEHYRVVP
jgi:fatty-acyl-CoA synthase